MPTTTPRRPAGRSAATRRPPVARPGMPRRRKPQPQSNGQKVLGMLTKALPPAAAAKRATPSGKGGKGLALLAAGGLAAFAKKRNAKKNEAEIVVEPATPVATTPVATTPPSTNGL